MAIHDSQNNGNTPEAPRSETRAEQLQHEPRDERRVRDEPEEVRFGASMADINRLLGGAMSRQTSGESLVDAIQAVKYWLDPDRTVAGTGNLDTGKFQILGLDAQEHSVSVSSVIVTYPYEHNGVTNVMTHVLVLEGTLADLGSTRTVDIGNRSYPLPIVASDYVTESYLEAVDDIVTKHYGQSRRGVTLVPAGWRVVSSSVDFKEQDSTEVRSVVFYAQAAITATQNELFEPELFFSLDWLNANSSLQIDVDLSGRPVMTADGLPRRSDIAISVAGQVRKGDQNVNIPLANLGGYVSIMYSPPELEDRWARDRRRDEPYFVPTFIINRMDTNTNGITPELLLLNLAAASVVSRSQSWAQGFLPGDVARGELDAKDTGLLNILGPDEDKTPIEFDTRQSLDIDKWGQYFFSLVDRDLAWAIELEEGGDNSWITSLLIDAASDNSKEGSAIRRLYAYADRLTNNNFTIRAKELGVESPLTMSGARYLTGTWTDEDGKQCPLADWDLLRWLATNPNDGGDSALRYQDVIDRTDVDVEIRISEQYEQLTGALTQDGVKFSRYVDLAYINPKFIEALAMAVADCQVNIDQRQAHYTFGAARRRGNARIRDFVGGDLTHGLLGRRNTGGAGQRTSRGPMHNGFGRGRF